MVCLVANGLHIETSIIGADLSRSGDFSLPVSLYLMQIGRVKFPWCPRRTGCSLWDLWKDLKFLGRTLVRAQDEAW